MPKPNFDEIRAQAEARKSEAKQKIQAAKREAENKKALRENPPDKYVELPEITGDAEVDSIADLTALQSGFRKRAMDEGKRFAQTTDTEYWACLCFQSRAQKEAFLGALNIMQYGDKYIDGIAVAKEMGIALPDADIKYNESAKTDKTWLSFTNQE